MRKLLLATLFVLSASFASAQGVVRGSGSSGGSGLTDTQLRATPVPVSGTFTSAGTGDTVGALTALGALNNAAVVALAGEQGANFHIPAGTLIGTLVPELSFDGGTTYPTATQFVNGSLALSNSLVFASANTATDITILILPGASHVRVRVSAYTSGTVSGTVRSTFIGNAGFAFGTRTVVGSGTAGAAAAGVVTVQGIASMTPLLATLSGTNNINTVTAVTAITNALPAGANVIGALTANQSVNTAQINGVTTATGNGLSGTGVQRVNIASDNTAFPVTAAGSLTNNNAVPGANNVGALVALANTAAPTYVNGDQVLLSVDTTGALRTTAPGGLAQGSTTAGQTGTLIQGAVTTAAPAYTTAQTSPISLDTSGRVRVLADINNGSTTGTEAATITANQASVAITNSVLYGFDGTTDSRLRSRAGLVSSADVALVTRPFLPSDGTNTMPAMDAIARPGYVAPTAAVTGGASTCYLTSAATTNATNCKASAGQVYSIRAVNTTTTNYFLRMYNLAAAPTCSSATGFIETIPLTGAAANGGGIATSNGAVGQDYNAGVGFCLTGGGSSTDVTNAATGVYVTILYK